MLTDSATTYQSRSCAVCQTTTEQEILYQKWGYPILRCKACHLGSAWIGDGVDASIIYSKGYFQGCRKDGYADYVGSERVLRREFRRVLNKIRLYGPSEGRLLEVGCAYGFLLLEAQQYFESYGIEICEDAARACQSRGLNVHCGTVNRKFLKENGPFDAMIMLDVIEHLQEPGEVLRWLYEALNRRGSLMISTGDWDSMFARLLKKHWRLMTPPQHLFYFSRRTMTGLLEKIGFRVA